MNTTPQILLVEDDIIDIELILDIFSEHNFADKTVVVRDGAEVLDYLYCWDKYSERQKVNPGVIILDLKMPKMDGLLVLKKLKGDDRMRKIPIVIFSSSQLDRDIKECYLFGVNAYIVKPVDYEEYTKVVRQIALFWGLS